MNASPNTDTDEYPILPSLSDVLPPRTASAAVQIDCAAVSHPGKVQLHNEDHFLVARFHRAMQTVLTNLPDGLIPMQAEEVAYGMVVADGVGGMASGEVASRLAIRTLVEL